MLRGLPLVAVAFLAACGGSGEGKPVTTSATPPPTQTSTAIVTVTVPSTTNPRPVPTGKPTFKLTITASTHAIRAGVPLRYTVRAVDVASRKPVSGIAKMRVFVGGQVVDTIGFIPLTGTLTKTYRFSPLLKGKNATLQAEVDGPGGTQRANWPVHVG